MKLKWEQRQRSNNPLPLQVFADCQYSLNCHPSATYSATAYSLAPGLSASAWMCPEQSLHCLQSLSLMTAHWPLTDSASSSPRFPWQSDFFSEQGSPACILPKVLKQSPLHPVALSVIPVHSGSVWGELSCAPPSSCTQVVLIPSWLLVLQWQTHHSLWSAHHQSSVSKNMVRFQFFTLGWHGSKHLDSYSHIMTALRRHLINLYLLQFLSTTEVHLMKVIKCKVNKDTPFVEIVHLPWTIQRQKSELSNHCIFQFIGNGIAILLLF